MILVDTNTFDISITKGDTGRIVFSAVNEDGTTFTPATGDVLTFAVAKKWDAEPIFDISNTYSGDADTFWTIVIGDEAWEEAETNLGAEMKPKDYVYDVQIATATDTFTIIGKTDELSPKFRVWGDVAE